MRTPRPTLVLAGLVVALAAQLAHNAQAATTGPTVSSNQQRSKYSRRDRKLALKSRLARRAVAVGRWCLPASSPRQPDLLHCRPDVR